MVATGARRAAGLRAVPHAPRKLSIAVMTTASTHKRHQMPTLVADELVRLRSVARDEWCTCGYAEEGSDHAQGTPTDSNSTRVQSVHARIATAHKQ